MFINFKVHIVPMEKDIIKTKVKVTKAKNKGKVYGQINKQSKELNPYIGDMVDVFIRKKDLMPGRGSTQDKARVGKISPQESRAGVSNSSKKIIGNSKNNRNKAGPALENKKAFDWDVEEAIQKRKGEEKK